ncbi:NepR family anti-sigma factor [Sphingopyxis sp. SE2]|uniref:NepR family anti-sigma factor n=2 Tax=unclassified Sphingopyxis TaxID=2614943 RepID=UPI001269F03F|nr:NepR family anti-sigma factor [Sphingopyxis sp. LC363]MDT7529283.1 NepR family anti-sigma factor [Sphingopyxis sp. SE2]
MAKEQTRHCSLVYARLAKGPCSADASIMSSKTGSQRSEASGKDAGKKPSAKGQDVNGALRRAYESTVDESIPQNLLDLLSKLD